MNTPKLSEADKDYLREYARGFAYGGHPVGSLVLRLLNEYAELRERTEWQPITGAPLDTWVWVADRNHMDVARRDHREWWADGGEYLDYKPTHWMHCPESPP